MADDYGREDDSHGRNQARERAMLSIRDLHVYYGESHAIQGIELNLPHGILSVVGRNGMGKTTLCNTIMGLTQARSGSIRFNNREIRGRAPNVIANLGIGYVPQGRRIWPSLTVDEHLRLAMRGGEEGAWSVDRIYNTFPRLAERRSNGGSQLSGGEQQMLAISRALLGNPHLLIMDEPTEGLAPVIVQQVERMLREIAADGDFAVLLVEQNIGVATEVAEQVAIMVNGRINRLMQASELAADRELQQRLLGVGRHSDDAADTEQAVDNQPGSEKQREPAGAQVQRVFVAAPSAGTRTTTDHTRGMGAPNRWGTDFPSIGKTGSQQFSGSTGAGALSPASASTGNSSSRSALRMAPSVADQFGKTALVAGTFDTKSKELMFLRDQLRQQGITTRTIDLSTSKSATRADVTPAEIASCHPRGSTAVFTNDRGSAVSAMAEAFEIWITRQRDIGGIISAGGSGGTSLVAPAMRALPVGVPKLIISTVASSDVSPYVGPVDITMMYSVTDVQGINSVSEPILRNGASAMAGMINALPSQAQRQASKAAAKPAIGITMFGVTTPCVQAITKRLDTELDCLVFHATGTGGRAMEKLVDSGAFAAVMDMTTTELADMHVGGVFPATDDRLGAVIRTRVPYVGSVGAMDMVNFGAMNTVPEKFRSRNLVVHNANVTLMRTTVEENRWLGEWLASRLNQMQGPVRFLLPEGGVSMLDAPGQPFHDPAANAALFEAIESNFQAVGNKRLIRVPANINDDAFVTQAVNSLYEIQQSLSKKRSA